MIRISEIFCSLQGEAKTVGIPTVFVRLTGCPLRCQYCDTEYAFHGGKKISMQTILEKIASYEVNYVTVTGGEPLVQPECLDLLKQLCDLNYIVSIETSGALDISNIDPRVSIVMDLKTPGSGEVDKNLMSNIQFLQQKDQVKFVICHEEDYQWTKKIIKQYQLNEKTHVLLSPSYQEQNATQLADWIIQDKLANVRMQIQLHKYLWGDKQGV